MPITHEWNGTILTITTDSGSSSCDLKGEKGDDGARGPQGAACVVATDTQMLGGYPAADYAKKTDTVANTQKLDGKEAKYYIQPYNLLDNSYLKNTVNQRGKQLYQQDGYCIDRWLIYTTDGTTVPVLNLATGHVRLGEKTYLQQRYPIGLYDITKTYTAVVWYADGDISLQHTNLTRYEMNGVGFDFINIFPNTKRDIEAVGLYEGEYTAENLPPYIPKGYAVELAECRRYYKILSKILVFTKGNTEWVEVCENFETMRVIPTGIIKSIITDAGISLNPDNMIVYTKIDSVESIQDKGYQFTQPAMARLIITIELNADL